MSLPKLTNDPRVVISLGQCGYDNSRIVGLVRGIDPDITVQTTDSAQETLDLLQDLGERTALVLVNRVFDTDGDSGIGFIQAMKRPGSGLTDIPVMLVSNYEKSQAEAIAHGALPGFGKSELQAGATRQRISAVLLAQDR